MAYSFRPVKSIATTDSFPTTQALCPVGITAVSPGPHSISAANHLVKKYVITQQKSIGLELDYTFDGLIHPPSAHRNQLVISPIGGQLMRKHKFIELRKIIEELH